MTPIVNVARAPESTYDAFIQSFTRRERCPLCSSPDRSSHYDKPIQGIRLTFSRCQGCSLVYQDPYPSGEGLRRYFSSSLFIKDDLVTEDLKDTLGYYDYNAWDESYRRTASLRLSVLTRFVAPPAALLEIGTATGSFLNEAAKRGFSVRGLDVSETFARDASRKYGLTIDQGFIEEARLPEEGYDVICAFGGIACWYDPLRALARIRQALKPGGLFMFNFSDVDNPLARLSGQGYPEYNHASMVIYSHRTMRDLLRRSGFEPAYDRTEWQYASLERIVTYWRSNGLWRLVQRLGLGDLTLRVPAIGTRIVCCLRS